MQPEGNNAVDGEKEKDDGRSKSFKVHRRYFSMGIIYICLLDQ